MSGYPVVPMQGRNGWHESGPLRAFVTHGGAIEGWHLSVSRRDRIPSWPEIMHVKRALIPDDVFMVVMVPPDRYWMNGMPNVIQLCEIRSEESGADLIQHMKDTRAMAEREGMPLIPCDGKDLTR